MVARSHSRSDWRQRGAESSPRTVPAPLSFAGAHILDELPQLHRLLPDLVPLRWLVAEAEGGHRRDAIRVFFEGLDTAIEYMMQPRNLEPPSPHQPGREGFLRVVNAKLKAVARLGRARRVVVRREDSGFFSSFLVVLDALLLAPPGAELVVDWRLSGDEIHFCYTPADPSSCVWSSLFEPIRRAGGAARPTGDAPPELAPEGVRSDWERAWEGEVVVGERWNLLFATRYRCLSRQCGFTPRHRALYHRLYAAHVRHAHADLVRELGVHRPRLRRGACVGVHKRVWTPGTEEYQGGRTVPTCDGFIEATRRLVSRLEASGVAVQQVFLATDDSHASAAFAAAFGSRLLVRDGVKRVGGGLNADGTLNEVHIKSPHNPGCGLRDAVDVMIDAELLAACGWLVHMDSNVSTAVSLISPAVELHHVADLLARAPLPRGADPVIPAEFVQRGYQAAT